MENNTCELQRREFIKKTSTCIFATMLGASMFNPDLGQADTGENMNDDEKQLKKDFFNYACSGALFLYVNRNYGHPKQKEALSVASLSGGIMQCGHQCGMLWGAALAAGAESYRRFQEQDTAIAKAITATQELTKSFLKKAATVNCREITNTNWSKRFSILKYLITGKTITCLSIAKKWAPKAVKTVEDSLSDNLANENELPVNCATEVAKKMNATKEKTIMVAGFAGGYGLNGHGCGALGAAVWIKSLDWFEKNPDSKDIYNPYAQKTLDAFNKVTNSEMRCKNICEKCFQSSKEHTEYIQSGGCSELIDVIANS